MIRRIQDVIRAECCPSSRRRLLLPRPRPPRLRLRGVRLRGVRLRGVRLLLVAALVALLLWSAGTGAAPASAQGIPTLDKKMITWINPAYLAALQGHNELIAEPRWETFQQYLLALTGGYDWRDLTHTTGRLGQPMASPQGLGWAHPDLVVLLDGAFPGLQDAADWPSRIRERHERMLRTYLSALEGTGSQMEGFEEALARIEAYRQRAQAADVVGAATHQLQAQLRLFLAEEWLLLRQQLMTQALMSSLDLARRTNRRAAAHGALERALGLPATPLPPPSH